MDARQAIELATRTLGEAALSAERMTLTHSGNSIFDVELPTRHVIVRMRGGDRDTLSRTSHNIRALAELGLPVPRVLAEDTSMTCMPFRYVILEKIRGRDLLYELPAMTRPRMSRLAEQIVAAQRTVGTLPLGTGYGWGAVGEGGPEAAWNNVLASEFDRDPPLSDGTTCGDLSLRLHAQRARFEPYFRSVRPVCFLEDLTTKNILLEHGELQGLIDFDCVCFGDPVWMIGLAAGCIVNDVGRQGLFYIDELCRCWSLTEPQRQAVTFYAAQRALEFLRDASPTGDRLRFDRLVLSIETWLASLEQG